MPITCRQCGWQSPDGAEFCSNKSCGAYLEWDATRTYQASPPRARARRPTTPGPQPQAAPQRAGVHLAIEQRALEVEPGDSVTTTVTIRNTGTLVENYRLVVQGPAADWAMVEPEAVSVYPDGSASSTLRFAPPRSAAAPAGQAWYGVRAISTLHPGLQGGADGTLSVGAFRELDAELVPRTTRGRFRTVHAVRLSNEGNLVEPVALQASDPEGLLRFGLPSGEVPVQPGTAQVDVTVQAPRRVIGRPQSYPFQVVVTPHDNLPALRLDGSRETAPLFARWVPVTAVAVAVLAALALLVVPRLPFDRASATNPPTTAPATGLPPPPTEPPATQPAETQEPPPGETSAPPPPTTQNPPPPPQVRAGQLEIPVGRQADVDEGAVIDDGADLFFGGESEAERFVAPVNGAFLAALDTNDDEPTVERCAEEPLGQDPVPLEALTGPFLCLRTDEQRLSLVRIDALSGGDSSVLEISFSTKES